MAFGDVKDAAETTATSTSATNTLTFIGGPTANVGDFIYALFTEVTSLTVTGVTDNLGNTYTPLNAGTDAGAVTARAFYSRVTISGVLTTITFAATASANDNICNAILIEGPISAIDKNLANITSDVTSPFSCPPTGTLTQADEIVVAWGAANYSVTWISTSPMAAVSQSSISGVIKAVIAYKVVTATTDTTPAFTAASNPTQAILGTSTFRKLVTETVTVTKATVTIAGKTVTVGTVETVPVTQATVIWTGKTVTIRELELVPVTQATVTMDGQTVVILSAGSDVVGVDQAAVTLVGKTVTVADTQAVIPVDKAVFALTGKSVGLLEKIAITKATVTFTGRTVTIVTSVFQDLPKYIIRGRGSRHELWTQGFGGTIKGRGSRTFLVMR